MFQNLMPCLNGQPYVWYHESHVSHMFQNLVPCLNGQSYVWYHESHVSHMIQIKCHMLNMGSHMFGTMCHMFHMFLSYEAHVCHMFAKKYSFLDIFVILQNVPVSYVSVICHMVFIWFSYVFHMFVICRLPSSASICTMMSTVVHPVGISEHQANIGANVNVTYHKSLNNSCPSINHTPSSNNCLSFERKYLSLKHC